MADIAMCNNSKCFNSSSCYRFTAPPGQFQSYVLFRDICNESNDYEWYMKDWRKENKEGE